MSENDEGKHIPPLVSKGEDGDLEWDQIHDIDFEGLGYFLSCHLIIEHYIDNVLSEMVTPKLGWEEARLSFSQKISLIEKSGFFKEKYDFLPSVKHINKLRNKISHNISFQLHVNDLSPLVSQIRNVSTADELPNEISGILQLYIQYFCSYCAGAITASSVLKKSKGGESPNK